MATTKERPAIDDVVAAGDDAGRRLVDTIAEVSTEAGDRLTAVASGAGEAIRDADRTLRGSSEQTLRIIGALSLGVTAGLSVGGANRLLIIVALLPAILVAMAAMERAEAGRPARSRMD
jgi:hypothetical protein